MLGRRVDKKRTKKTEDDWGLEVSIEGRTAMAGVDSRAVSRAEGCGVERWCGR